MLVRLWTPKTREQPDGFELWIDAESIDRVEGEWDERKCTIYLKRNPAEPFMVVPKSARDVALQVNEGLSLTADKVRDLANAVQDLVELLRPNRR